jgi:dTMP kinase
VVKNGKFIVLEGIDGSGKSTIIQKLTKKFNELNWPLHTSSEPTKNPIGSLLRKILTHEISSNEQTIAALFLADRVDHINHPEYGMKQFLDKGVHVICDRYYLSSFAYHVPHVTLDWVVEANSLASDVLIPDLTLFIDISVQTSLDRINSNRTTIDLFETEDRITQVKENYAKAIEKVKHRESIVMINGELDADLVFEKVWDIVSGLEM